MNLTIYEPPNNQTSPIRPSYYNYRLHNAEVAKVYTRIITDLRFILSRLSYAESRTYLIQSYMRDDNPTNVLTEFVCILCSLTLSIKEDRYIIELDTDIDIERIVGEINYRAMLRSAYRNTMFENTNSDIEDCLSVNTDKLDHYNYFKRRIKEDRYPESLVMVEDPIFE